LTKKNKRWHRSARLSREGLGELGLNLRGGSKCGGLRAPSGRGVAPDRERLKVLDRIRRTSANINFGGRYQHRAPLAGGQGGMVQTLSRERPADGPRCTRTNWYPSYSDTVHPTVGSSSGIVLRKHP